MLNKACLLGSTRFLLTAASGNLTLKLTVVSDDLARDILEDKLAYRHLRRQLDWKGPKVHEFEGYRPFKPGMDRRCSKMNE